MSPLRLFNLWRVAMKAEGLPVWRKALPMAWQAIGSLPWVSRRQWRSRLRACMRCPIYDRETHRCRQESPTLDPVARLGCGCSCPVKFLFAGETCWAREHNIVGVGWPEDIS